MRQVVRKRPFEPRADRAAPGIWRACSIWAICMSRIFVDVPDATRWPRVPLELLLCSRCSLLQLRHTTPSDWLYRRYWHKSGVNASLRTALGDITRKASEFVGLANGDTVLDTGCNDGTLLRSYTVSGNLPDRI